jgi:hypothetical protein
VTDSPTRDVVQAAYARLREKLEAKDVKAESLRTVALDALDTVTTLAVLEPNGIADELERLRAETGPVRDESPT